MIFCVNKKPISCSPLEIPCVIREKAVGRFDFGDFSVHERNGKMRSMAWQVALGFDSQALKSQVKDLTQI